MRVNECNRLISTVTPDVMLASSRDSRGRVFLKNDLLEGIQKAEKCTPRYVAALKRSLPLEMFEKPRVVIRDLLAEGQFSSVRRCDRVGVLLI